MLAELAFEGVRNLQPVTVSPSPGLNVFAGPNGSGKTSILEAVAILALGRSFRTSRLSAVCRTGGQQFWVTGRLEHADGCSDRVGVVWDGERRSRLNLEWMDSHASVVERFPVIVLHADSHEQMVQLPSERRRILDWGAFYSQSEFRVAWKRWRRAHDQRNAWLRQSNQGLAPADAVLEPFEAETAEYGTRVTAMRAGFVDQLQRQLCSGHLGGFLSEQALKVDLIFRRGWAQDLDLGAALAKSRGSDSERGFGQVGPQRADLEVRVNGRALREASRGEQKRVVSTLLFGQGQSLGDEGFQGANSKVGFGLMPVFLLDDPMAELDSRARTSLVHLLDVLGWQVLLTTTDLEWALGLQKERSGVKLFHVEHGVIREG